MKFYQHWIGDYQKATRRLSMLEHGAYRLLLDEYYSTEVPLPSNPMQLHRICMAFASEEQAAVHSVLDIFFTATPDGYIHARVEEEIDKSRKKSKKRSFAAKRRWDNHTNADANACTDADANAYANAIHKSQPQPQPDKNIKLYPGNSDEQPADTWRDSFSSEVVEFVDSFQKHTRKEIGARAPKVTESLLRSATDTVDKLIRIDEHSLEEIKDVMRWAVKDEFWRNNALSLSALRKKTGGLTKFQKILSARQADTEGQTKSKVLQFSKPCVYQDYSCP